MSTNFDPKNTLTGFLHEKLVNGTGEGETTGKVAGRIAGDLGLLIASVMEVVVRAAIFIGAKIVLHFKKDDEKSAFEENYVTPNSKNFQTSKDVFSRVKTDLIDNYNTHMKPFLFEKVQLPTAK